MDDFEQLIIHAFKTIKRYIKKEIDGEKKIMVIFFHVYMVVFA
jgi:hypothetical protein